MATGIDARPDREAIHAALHRIIDSPEFAQAHRLSKLLLFLVESTYVSEPIPLKETIIGVEVFERDPGYDPKLDGVVRTEARRLRQKLQEYYLGSGSSEAMRIVLPKGGYRPVIEVIEPDSASPASLPAGLEGPPPSRLGRRGMVAIAATLALLGAAGAVALLFRRPAPGGGQSENVARPLTTHYGVERTPSLSRDGKRVAFSLQDRRGTHIFVTEAGESSEENLVQVTDQPESDYEPVWSPDGTRIAFIRQSIDPPGRYAIHIVDVASGATKPLVQVSFMTRLSWSGDGRVLAYTDRSSPEATTAIRSILTDPPHSQTQLTFPPTGIRGDTEPSFSFDGLRIAFQREIGPAIKELHVQELTVSQTPVGDPKRVKLAGGVAGFCWAPGDDALIASVQAPRKPRGLWRVAIEKPGRPAPAPTLLVAAPGVYPASSQAAARLVYALPITDTNLWRVQREGGEARQIVGSTQLDTTPRFSPDGKRLAFRSNRSGMDEIWIADAASWAVRRLTRLESMTGSPRWSPDGRLIAFDTADSGNSDVMLIEPSQGGIGAAAPRRLTHARSNEVTPGWSPDGKYVYYASDRSGRWEVWRQRADGTGSAEQVTLEGGFVPVAKEGYLWYARSPSRPGVFRRPLAAATGSAGGEEPVLPDLPGEMWGNWAVSNGEIFYMEYRDGETTLKARPVRGLGSAATPRTVHTLNKPHVRWDGGLDVSPDGRWLVFSQLDQLGSDLYVAENVR